MSIAIDVPTGIPFRDQWAQFVSYQKYVEDFAAATRQLEAAESNGNPLPGPSTDGALPPAPKPVEFQKLAGSAPDITQIPVGIVGAGAAGLFTGMIFDFLNTDKTDGIHFDYEILEANSEERVGGRLYTHYFDEARDKKKHQYYDVGAMRFPDIPIMDRTFRLFDYLNKGKTRFDLLPYYMNDEINQPKIPMYFNDVQRFGIPTKDELKAHPDPFGLNTKWRNKDDQIDPQNMRLGPDKVIGTALEGFRQQLKMDIDKGQEDGWKNLMRADAQSTRAYLRATGKNYNTITWLETFEYGTGWYDQSLSETALESMDFDYPKDNEKDPDPKWKCIEGGAQELAKAMQDTLQYKPQYDKTVTKITQKKVNDQNIVTAQVRGEEKPREYYALFNSTTLGALQRMDITEAGINYPTKQAIRCLGYGASCKVAIQFSEAWWMQEPWNLDHGGVSRTDLPLRVCVYPSYNVDDPKYGKPAVLLCSYSWAQDAQRLGALISPDSPVKEDDLRELLLRNLALLHTPQVSTQMEPHFPTYEELLARLNKSYIKHHAFDWYADPYMSGAFAYFGPDQFANSWPELARNTGWLWIIGEASSAHHAWVVGALESAVRAVWSFLYSLTLADPKHKAAYESCMAKLDSEDPDNKPFAPLPLEMNKQLVKRDIALGFWEAKKEMDAKAAGLPVRSAKK